MNVLLTPLAPLPARAALGVMDERMIIAHMMGAAGCGRERETRRLRAVLDGVRFLRGWGGRPVPIHCGPSACETWRLSPYATPRLSGRRDGSVLLSRARTGCEKQDATYNTVIAVYVSLWPGYAVWLDASDVTRTRRAFSARPLPGF